MNFPYLVILSIFLLMKIVHPSDQLYSFLQAPSKVKIKT